MDLYDLQNTHHNRQRKKRVGRGIGSGRGKTCTKGTKGDKARSGYKRRAGNEGGQMPMHRKVPIRGFSRERFKKEIFSLNLADIEEKFAEGDTINISTLIAKRVLPSKCKAHIKILGDGQWTKKCNFEVYKVSASAKAKIEEKGGSIQLLCSGS